ncbi:MAG TPA: hypothetical protein VMW24_12775 [Sedimentisphaerales bacterium]|nr:hypothetical protein [Sedimentisphaerales bacterium]
MPRLGAKVSTNNWASPIAASPALLFVQNGAANPNNLSYTLLWARKKSRGRIKNLGLGTVACDDDAISARSRHHITKPLPCHV